MSKLQKALEACKDRRILTRDIVNTLLPPPFRCKKDFYEHDDGSESEEHVIVNTETGVVMKVLAVDSLDRYERNRYDLYATACVNEAVAFVSAYAAEG